MFREAVPGSSLLPVPIPPQLWQLTVTQMPDWQSPTWRSLLENSIAQSTRRAYSSAQQQYLQFCQLINFHPCLPATVILFVTHLAQKCCHSTIRSYLSAVRFLHVTHDLLQGKLCLEQLLIGVRGMYRRGLRGLEHPPQPGLSTSVYYTSISLLLTLIFDDLYTQ